MNKIDEYLQAALQRKASDLHFVSGDPVRARVDGNLGVLKEEHLDLETAKEALYEIMDGTTQRAFQKEEAADFAYNISCIICLFHLADIYCICSVSCCDVDCLLVILICLF